MNKGNEEEAVPDVGEAFSENSRQLTDSGLDSLVENDAPSHEEPVVPVAIRIGDYEVISELGRGGMGVVYKARQCSLNRIVAIKMILVTKFASEVHRLRFFREAELVASLNHPNIVAIHEIGEYEGQPFYSMDFIEGSSLKGLVQENPLPWAEAARFAQLIAQAMQVAHDHGVIHRDLKPQNILVDRLRKPHVADFGLAHDLNTDSGLTMSQDLLGTPNYMPPEQSGVNGTVGPATDVYAIGAVLYDMLTTLPPIFGGNLSEILDKVRNKDPIAPRLINPSVPRDLNTVCLKCLQKDPGRRYQTANELADELDRVLHDLPIKAKPISPAERGWRWCKRNRHLASVIAGSATIIVLGTVFAFIEVNREKNHALKAEKQAELEKNQVEQANAAIVAKNKELETALDEITHQKGVIYTAVKSDAQRDIVQANGLFRELHLAEAQAAANKIVSSAPNLPDGWYLHGQLALVQGDLSSARQDLQKAADLSPDGLDATGLALLALVNQYALTAQQSPGGKLTARDALNLLHDLRGKQEYFAFVEAQKQARDLLLQAIRSALAMDNGSKFADAGHAGVSEEGGEIILTLKDIPNDPDLSGMRQFPVFTVVHIENTGISSLAPLAGMQLARVEVIGSPVANLDALKGMPLTSLTLKNTKVSDLAPLRDAPLNSITLDGVPFPSGELLARWPLDNLQIAGVPLPDHFTVPQRLHSLGLARTGLGDLQLVASCSLDSLDVSGNPGLSSLDPLRGMTTLRELDLSDTKVTDLEPLAGLKLENLSLRNTPVDQISCLPSMPLQVLDLRGCTIHDLDKLTKVPPKFYPPQSQ